MKALEKKRQRTWHLKKFRSNALGKNLQEWCNKCKPTKTLFWDLKTIPKMMGSSKNSRNSNGNVVKKGGSLSNPPK